MLRLGQKKAATLMHELLLLLEINHSETKCPPLQINAAPSVHKLYCQTSFSSDKGPKDEPWMCLVATLSYQSHFGFQARIRYPSRRTYRYQGLIVSHSDERWSKKNPMSGFATGYVMGFFAVSKKLLPRLDSHTVRDRRWGIGKW